LLCYASYQLVQVMLPLFVQSLGGSPVIAGLVFTSFSVTSFILRPLVGHLTDTWSARGVLAGGAALLGSLGLAFVVPSLWVAFIANAVRGVGWGAFSTAVSTAVALLSPPARRGEASGAYSVSTTTASAFAPALALWLLNTTGEFAPAFALAGATGLLAIVAIAAMPRIGSGTGSLRGALALPSEGFAFESFVERPVLLASLLLVSVTMTGPVTFAFVPLHARAVGVENIGLYFVASAATSILARLLLGRLLDHGSRGQWIVVGYGVLVAAFGVFILANTIEIFVAAGILNALGHSFIQPSLMALAIDRAAPGRMGKAMATYSMAYRVGEGLGAPLAGALIVAFSYPGMYVGAMGYATMGLLLTVLNWGSVGKPVGHRVLSGGNAR
jgi:MFS family permease